MKALKGAAGCNYLDVLVSWRLAKRDEWLNNEVLMVRDVLTFDLGGEVEH